MNDNPETTSESQASAPQPAPTPPAAAPTTTHANPPAGGGMVSQDEKTQGLLIWVLSIIAGFIPGLIFFLIAKDKPFVHRHAGEALTLTLLVAVVNTVLFVTVVGIALVPLVMLFNLIICVMGAMAANKGEEYNPPIAAGLAKSIFHV